jgi:hypothetical protein
MPQKKRIGSPPGIGDYASKNELINKTPISILLLFGKSCEKL